MINHTVVFCLKHLPGSEGEAEFLASTQVLENLPGVEQFQCLRQISNKNPYRFGLSMVFADETAYQGYNEHPDHLAFLKQRWLPEVEEFMEIDYQPLY